MSHAPCPRTRAALAGLLERFLARHREAHGGLPGIGHDPHWPSPCEVGEPDAQGRIRWQPVERPADADGFGGVEAALETPVHPSVKAFYGSFWCAPFAARAEEGALTLIQVWSPADFDRLCENLLGHALAQRRGRVPLSLFVACTDEDDLILSVDNATGAVVLEQPGRAPLREVAPSLAEFLDRVEPEPEDAAPG